jgi:hypothetical protein
LAIFEATFSNASSDFNSSTAPFPVFEQPNNIAVQSGPQSRFLAYEQQGTGTRQFELVLEKEPTACKSYTTPDTPAAGAPSLRLLDGGKFWWCGGTVIVDTVVGLSYQFHFDTVCKSQNIGTTAVGTVRIVGRGAGTTRIN